jgi:hypothetical protein
LSLLVAELLLEALEGLGKPIKLARLLQTVGAPIQGHLGSYHDTYGAGMALG